jgi:large subunit ribosomal protein L10
LAISKQRKTEICTQYVEQLKRSQGIILANYRSLTVHNMDDVRRTVRPVGARFQVIKNNLLALALKEAGLSVPEEWLIGPTAVGFCFEEVPPVAKVLKDMGKDLEQLQIKGGLLGTAVMSREEMLAIAELPSREALLAQVLGTINAPARQVAGIVASGIRQVVNVLQAHVDNLQETGAAAAA